MGAEEEEEWREQQQNRRRGAEKGWQAEEEEEWAMERHSKNPYKKFKKLKEILYGLFRFQK